MAWELIEAQDRECTMDSSGMYVVINRVVKKMERMCPPDIAGKIVRVRVDLMADGSRGDSGADFPLVSFIGKANAVRKALMAYLDGQYNHRFPDGSRFLGISREHASYIGYELHKCEVTTGYVQS